MSFKQFKAAVKKFNGWIEGDIARFPRVYDKVEFEKYVAKREATK